MIHKKIRFTIQKNRKTIHDSNLDSITMVCTVEYIDREKKHLILSLNLT